MFRTTTFLGNHNSTVTGELSFQQATTLVNPQACQWHFPLFVSISKENFTRCKLHGLVKHYINIQRLILFYFVCQVPVNCTGVTIAQLEASTLGLYVENCASQRARTGAKEYFQEINRLKFV